MADDCGFENPLHPYTQTTRGASPWERVPDLLHMHGFCSHHNWFSYRQALWTELCPIPDSIQNTNNNNNRGTTAFIGGYKAVDGAAMACNISTTRWPWIFERFDMQQADLEQTMASGRTLLPIPHVCDESFMHLQNPYTSERFKICSGIQGFQERLVGSYDLAPPSQQLTAAEAAAGQPQGRDWGGAQMQKIEPNVSHWLRTYDEDTDALHIGIIDNDISNDVPLGFLGASASLDGVMGDMAQQDTPVNFFRCADRLACKPPTFTYNGMTVDRLDPLTLSGNFSEISLRRCGSIGYMAYDMWPGGSVCWLQIEFFPLLMQILWGLSNGNGCQAIWPSVPSFLQLIRVSGALSSQTPIQSNPASFFCETIASASTTARGRCAYAARASTRIDSSNEQDSVMQLTESLNKLVRGTGDAIKTLASLQGTTRTYENINQCIAQLMLTITISQAPMQAAYNSWGASGIYYGLRVTLYEIPLAWLHHAMLISLLSLIDPNVPAPSFDNMAAGAVPLFLWGEDDKGVFCRTADLEVRPVLWKILCLNVHPAYTFSVESAFVASSQLAPDGFVQTLFNRVVQDIKNELPGSLGSGQVFCYTKAAWYCSAITDSQEQQMCSDAVSMAYNTSYCTSTIDASSAKYLDPCANPELFNLQEPQSIEIESLKGGPQGGIDTYLHDVQQRFLDAALNVANPVEFISTDTWIEMQAGLSQPSSTNTVPVARIWPVFLQPTTSASSSSSSSSSFNFTDWLQHGICYANLDPYAVCSSQYDTTSADQCLYPWNIPESDIYRYLNDNNNNNNNDISTGSSNSRPEPIIKVTYANGDVDIINVCDIENANYGGEACFVQHQGSTDMYITSSDPSLTSSTVENVPCDIVSIDVPAGVQVQAYSVSLPLAQWWQKNLIGDSCSSNNNNGLSCPMTACTPSPPSVSSCSWRPPPSSTGFDDPTYPTWDSVYTGRKDIDPSSATASNDYLDGFNSTTRDFSEMKKWWPDYTALWESAGCRNEPGVCSLKIRLEQTADTKGVCGYNPATTRAVEQATLTQPPNCKAILNNPSATPFAIVVGNQSALYRCAPCTRYSKYIAPTTIAAAASSPYFGCYLSSSSNTGAAPEDAFALDALDLTMAHYLTDPSALLAMMPGINDNNNNNNNNNNIWKAAPHPFTNGTAMDLSVALDADTNPAVSQSLLRWNQLPPTTSQQQAAACYAQAPAGCWTGYDINYFVTDDTAVWNRAVQNPNIEFTMTCQSQRYRPEDSIKCNPQINTRRSKLSDFVDSQYRKINGMWLHSVPANTGMAWEANVAHSKVGMFTVMYAAANRAPQEIVTKWILGEGPCSAEPTVIQDRICVESINSPGTFEPMHPWLGGDFNPLEQLDECQSTGSMCACTCSPGKSCDASPLHNYTKDFMAFEFPSTQQQCIQQALPSIRTMKDTDASNLCSLARNVLLNVDTATTVDHFQQCVNSQGLLGGQTAASRSVTSDELHGDAGVLTAPQEFLVQHMYDAPFASSLWAGNTLMQASQSSSQKYAFLKMPREYLHPAHIAFAHNMDVTGQPLLVSGILLLPYQSSNSEQPLPADTFSSLSWITSLQQQWESDSAWVQQLYPQLLSPVSAAASKSLWSCPLRATAFWGAADRSSSSSSSSSSPLAFAPVVPHPPFAALLYKDLGGAHPLIQTRSIASSLAAYATTNGACFYQLASPASATSGSIIQIDVWDSQNPCGLQGIMASLSSGAPVLSKVMNSFADRCNDILDTPDLGAQLRSGETLAGTNLKEQTCGVLHRLTPFKMRIRGDATSVTLNSQGLTTRHNGGDCHMGRALMWPFADRKDIAGVQCTLISKNSTDAYAACPLDGSSRLFKRARPLTLTQLLSKGTRRYRIQGLISPQFIGPGGVILAEAEFSFGRLYATSLRRKLAHDLVSQGCNDPLPGKGFIGKYSSGNPSANCSRAVPLPPPPPSSSSTVLSAASHDAALWNSSDWTWSFYTAAASSSQNAQAFPKRQKRGTVDRTLWMRNRFAACNKSYQTYAADGAGMAVKPITLCEPSPTPGLQVFCKAMLQYRTDIANINCQIGGACLYRPGAFYVPYVWSTTNQEFAADTLNAYYASIVAQPRFSSNESYTRLCPARNSLMKQLAILSQAQASQCPAYQIEYLKNVLQSIKKIGNDLLYMGYCLVMYFANVLGAAFSEDSLTLMSMLQVAETYLVKFIDVATSVLMPILNAAVNIIFGTSSIGKVIKEALSILCQTYNYILQKVYVPIWCIGIRPSLYYILDRLSDFIWPFSSSAANKIRDVWTALAGGDSGADPLDISSCIGSIHVSIACDSGSSSILDQANASQFLVQPLATRCWSNIAAGSSSVLGGGISAATYLSCTESDTCAPDPLNFDTFDASSSAGGGSASNLIPCSSCPSLDGLVAGEASRFGCDTYLKRCTCGVRKGAPAACITSSDCSSSYSTTVCAVSSNLDSESISEAFASMLCSQCGSTGMLPVCISGTCACAALDQAGALQTCIPAMRGQHVSLLQSSGECLASTDKDIPFSLSATMVLDFSTLAVVSCSLGISDNACLGIQLPLASGSGQYVKSFVVIFLKSTSSITGKSRRRLLMQDALAVTTSESESALRLKLDVFFSDPASTITHFCKQALAKASRTDVKWCIHWSLVAAVTVAHPESTDNDTKTMGSLLTGPSALATMAQLAWNGHTEPLLFILKQHSGALPAIMHTVVLAAANLNGLAAANFSNLNSSMFHSHPNRTAGRKLQALPDTAATVMSKMVPAVSFSCPAFDEPLQGVIAAFFDTVTYYQDGHYNTVDNSLSQAGSESQSNSTPNTNNNYSSNASSVATYVSRNWMNLFYFSYSSSSSFSGYSNTTSTTPQISTVDNGGFIANVADAILMGQGRKLIADFFIPDSQTTTTTTTTSSSLSSSSSSQQITGRRLFRELGTCNYTTLTLTAPAESGLLFIAAAVAMAIFVISALCIPSGSSTIVTWLLWVMVFPMAVLWMAYGMSPMCWPMLPPRLPHDLAVGAQSLLPDNIQIPRFLVENHCTIAGLLSDGTYDSRCFKRCSDSPFLMQSWQDPLAWWICDLSPDLCLAVGRLCASFLPHFRASTAYFADVLSFSSIDPDFVAAHRFCAFMTLYQIVFAAAVAAWTILVLPSVLLAVAEIFAAAFMLILQASGAQSTLAAIEDDDNE